MVIVTMPRKVFTAALETSDWLRDHGGHVKGSKRRGKGYTVIMAIPADALNDLIWHVETLADSLAGEPWCAADVRAMRAWLGK